MAVYFQCKVCGEEHPLPGPLLPRSRVAFEMHVYIGDANLACPTKQERARYTKEELYWRD